MTYYETVSIISSRANITNFPLPIPAVFFALSRAYLGYFAHVYPNGQSWLPTFICYATMNHDLNRSKCIISQTWEAFHDIVPYRGELEDSPMRPPDLVAGEQFVTTFTYHFGKGTNKEVKIPQTFIGRIDSEALPESPNVIFWLNLHLMELFGIGLLQLKSEKRADSELWNTIKTCYMFPGERKSDTYTAEQANKHLREVATYVGLGDRIVGSIVAHSSFRGGGAQESAVNVSKGKTSTRLNTC